MVSKSGEVPWGPGDSAGTVKGAEVLICVAEYAADGGVGGVGEEG
jgi:hypothetical protein